MNVVYGKNINEITYALLEKVILHGYRNTSRNGDVLIIYDNEIILDNPKSRHLNLIGRTNNIFATFAEIIWILAGEEKINPYLTFFLPRAPLYSDDKKVWRGSYGKRLYEYGQLQNIIDIFKEEGIHTRKAVLTLYMPNKDTKESLKKEYNLSTTLDIPCNMLINFFVLPDKTLNMKVFQRSGDVIFGVSNINIFEFTILQEMILQQLKDEVDSELTLGYYHHSVTNLHLYDFNGQQGYKILDNKLKHQFGQINQDKIFFPQTINLTKKFFQELIITFNSMILTNNKSNDFYQNGLLELKKVFQEYKVITKKNLLWGYTSAILAYIAQKKGLNHINLEINDFSNEFIHSVRDNHFNKNIIII